MAIRKARLTKKRMYVLDTNVYMHNPRSLFSFDEHDIFLPMAVVEELDRNKKGGTEVARNVREVTRYIGHLIRGKTQTQLQGGVLLVMPDHGPSAGGKLYIELNGHASTGNGDPAILKSVMEVKARFPNTQVVLVTKDMNMQIRAAIHGIDAEDYQTDQAVVDIDLLPRGYKVLPKDFWERHETGLESWTENGRAFYRIRGADVTSWYPNSFVSTVEPEAVEFVVRDVRSEEAVIERIDDYTQQRHNVWGISARNPGQNYALNLLMDQDVDLVALLGPAGTGKTLLTLAAALHLTLDQNRYNEIIVTRAMVPVGEEIGFLPGTEEEKQGPWMGGISDNMEVLMPKGESEWGRAATTDLYRHRISIKAMSLVRGRSFFKKFVVLDEAQNLTAKQMKTLVSRAGPGTKVVCLGNTAQIDTPYLTETTSGLTYLVERAQRWPHGGHVILEKGERSRLADFANDWL